MKIGKLHIFNECLHEHGMGAYHGRFLTFNNVPYGKGIRLSWGAYGNKDKWYHIGFIHYPHQVFWINISHGAIGFIYHDVL